jgi:hypothetical protein
MKQMPAAKFKEHCLAILDEVDEEGIVITKPWEAGGQAHLDAQP